MLWVVAILTMVVGSVIAIVQTDVKRMLAYSSIAHAGFILVGVLAMDRSGISGVLFYLLAYGFTTIGAFAARHAGPRLRGGRRSAARPPTCRSGPGSGVARRWLAGLFTLFLLAFAGIPLTSGFIGKYAVFSAAVAERRLGRSCSSVCWRAPSLRSSTSGSIVLMYFSEPPGPSTVVAAPGPALTVRHRASRRSRRSSSGRPDRAAQPDARARRCSCRETLSRVKPHIIPVRAVPGSSAWPRP